MAPLSEPVDTNPITKEPPLFSDGALRPYGNWIDSFVTNIAYDEGGSLYDCVYNPDNGELFVMYGYPGEGEISVYDGYNGSFKRNFTFNVNDLNSGPSSLDITPDGNLITWTKGNTHEVKTISSLNGAAIQSFNLSLNIETATKDNDVIIMDPDNGDMLFISVSADTGSNHLWRFDGISQTVKDDYSLSVLDGLSNTYVTSVTFIGGNLVAHSGDVSATIMILDGLKNTVLASANINDPNSIYSSFAGNMGLTVAPVDGINRVISNSRSPSDMIIVASAKIGDEGLAFEGTSGKTLETGKIYSFRIRGPNQTTTPTINDDGQGAVTVTLPNGIAVPLQSLTGNLDFYYNGSNYIVQTLTAGIAEAIYDYQGAVQDNMTATSDPTSSDDEDAGYSIRSRWYNTSSGEAFLCVDASAGAAIWVKASLTLDELGSAATQDVGTAVGDVTQLEDVGGGTAGMPAVDGSQLTGIGSAPVATGTYTGDGTEAHSITGLGFRPVFVKIEVRVTTNEAAQTSFETTDQIVDDNADGGAIQRTETVNRFVTNRIISLDSDGFTVDDAASDFHPNEDGQIYNYLAIGSS